jgi:hypothetical protein
VHNLSFSSCLINSLIRESKMTLIDIPMSPFFLPIKEERYENKEARPGVVSRHGPMKFL